MVYSKNIFLSLIFLNKQALFTAKLIVITLLLLLQLNSFAQNPNPSAALNEIIQDEMDLERFPGVATIIVKNGKIVWLQSYGYADIEQGILVQDTTVFLLASLSKVFTGTAAMQLHENGIINLDDAITDYLPWSVYNPNYPNDVITFRQLMTHTSSIQDNGIVLDTYYDYPDPTISLADCMQRYFSISGVDYDPDENFLTDAPGDYYMYSNIATALNGYLVERAADMPFDDYCTENIFAPLCMSKTAWHIAAFDTNEVARPYAYSGGNYVPYPHYGFADYPDGQLRSNVVDIGNFMLAYLSGGMLGTNSFISQASINEMWSEQVPELEPSQGLNWYQEELYHSNGTTWLWGHNGGESGASTDMYLDPVNDIGICVLTNGEGDALYICDALYNYALSLNAAAGIIPNCTDVLGNERIEPIVPSVFPNPTTNTLSFDLSAVKGNSDIVILNYEGKEVLRKNNLAPALHRITFDLPFGMYVYRIVTSSVIEQYCGKFLVVE